MRQVAILVSGSRNAAFYSQIATMSAAVRALTWVRWRPSVHAYLGGPATTEAAGSVRWSRYLKHVSVTHITGDSYSRNSNWAQVDAALELAPKKADAVVVLDADTLPVAGFEDVLDRVADEDLVAGVIAHYPPPGIPTLREWAQLVDGTIQRPIVFAHSYSLVEPDVPDEARVAPFYVNGGVMVWGRSCFDRFVPRYLALRSKLSSRVDDAFSGQIASTLAVTDADLKTWALPMRYNFPNDPVADRLHPTEAANVTIHHYLRTHHFDRHEIFTTPQAFERFLGLALSGTDRLFQEAVRKLFDSRYPFA